LPHPGTYKSMRKEKNTTYIGVPDKISPFKASPVKAKPDTASITIPLKRIGKLYLIEATIDGETGNLVFDTGASCLVLNRTYFRDHISTGEQSPAGITGSVVNTERVAVNNAAIGSLKFKRLSANLSDLGHIENRRGVKIIGLFGFDLIKNYQVQIDYSSNQLRLYPIDNKGQLLNPSARLRADFSQKIEVRNNIIFTKASISGRSLKFCFDTGAETNVLSSDLPKSVMETVTITRTSKLRGAGASSSDVFYGQMNNFVFGDSLFNRMETVITYLGHLNESYGIQIDGILGFDFISKGIICINFVNNQMGITYFRQQHNESN
jgi:predicted aspartyl protease